MQVKEKNKIRILEKKLENARSALKVISTWANFRNGCELIPDHVKKLCEKALKETECVG